MMKNIHFFSAGESIKDKAAHAKIGIRGQRAMELASIGLPGLSLAFPGRRTSDPAPGQWASPERSGWQAFGRKTAPVRFTIR